MSVIHGLTGPAGMARAAVKSYRAYRDAQWRRVPAFRVHEARGAASVYYLTPHTSRPHGGVRVAYRHVDLLNELGVHAAIVHTRGESRPTWFESSTPVASLRSLTFRADDILVVPEVYGPALAALDPDVRVLAFNQGGYITFDALDYARTRAGSPYSDVERLEGVMTVSQDSAALLALSFPGVPVDVARPVIDPHVFHPGAEAAGPAFAFVTTRRGPEREQILHILRSRGLEWRPTPLSGMTEREVADAMRRSRVFLSLSDRDGFGLPPAEAMACGCYVVGYPGGGGEEFFDPAYCAPASSTMQVVAELERAMRAPAAELAAAGRRASEAVLGRYTRAGLRGDLSRVFERLV